MMMLRLPLLTTAAFVLSTSVFASHTPDETPLPGTPEASPYINGGLSFLGFMVQQMASGSKQLLTTPLTKSYRKEYKLLEIITEIEHLADTTDAQVKSFQPYLLHPETPLQDKQDIATVLAALSDFQSAVKLSSLRSTLLFAYSHGFYLDKHNPTQILKLAPVPQGVPDHSHINQAFYEMSAKGIWRKMNRANASLKAWFAKQGHPIRSSSSSSSSSSAH